MALLLVAAAGVLTRSCGSAGLGRSRLARASSGPPSLWWIRFRCRHRLWPGHSTNPP